MEECHALRTMSPQGKRDFTDDRSVLLEEAWDKMGVEALEGCARLRDEGEEALGEADLFGPDWRLFRERRFSRIRPIACTRASVAEAAI